ncbi:hypothetical protein Mame01_04180 [Microbispora amethystogenes]|nr:hypothetical protein Mame01_04180 [Microbispora amethystogenes]
MRRLGARLVEPERQEQFLHRDVAVEQHVVGVPHHPHAAAAHRGQQPVTPPDETALPVGNAGRGAPRGSLTLWHRGDHTEQAIGRHRKGPQFTLDPQDPPSGPCELLRISETDDDITV